MIELFSQRVAFPNALLLFQTEDAPEVPDIDGVANKWQTSSMLALAVLHDAEGEVDLQIRTDTPSPKLFLLFEGRLRSTRKQVQLITVYLDTLANIRTSGEHLDLRVWGDDPRQPEVVIIECLTGVEVDPAPGLSDR
ncbi:hypothetical protein [Pseudarthrobacter sp. Y6]|uniref:hypothetical protein n=1 Tax=Pseudarthrobacter sp. Y6 TaxID=3418422 RepID=UPI003CEFB348